MIDVQQIPLRNWISEYKPVARREEVDAGLWQRREETHHKMKEHHLLAHHSIYRHILHSTEALALYAYVLTLPFISSLGNLFSFLPSMYISLLHQLWQYQLFFLFFFTNSYCTYKWPGYQLQICDCISCQILLKTSFKADWSSPFDVECQNCWGCEIIYFIWIQKWYSSNKSQSRLFRNGLLAKQCKSLAMQKNVRKSIRSINYLYKNNQLPKKFTTANWFCQWNRLVKYCP